MLPRAPRSTPVPCTTLFRAVRLEGALTEEQRERLREIAHKCPVHRTLTGEVVVTELPDDLAGQRAVDGALVRRSGEHTSELQSPMYLVCPLLLEKKKMLHQD